MRTIAELKAADLTPATCASIGIIPKPDADPIEVAKQVALVNEYLKAFLPPSDEGRCVRCDTEQGGLVADLTGTGFQFGMVHGEGECGTCGYPGRAVHKIDGIGTISGFILQYHPSVLEQQTESAAS